MEAQVWTKVHTAQVYFNHIMQKTYLCSNYYLLAHELITLMTLTNEQASNTPLKHTSNTPQTHHCLLSLQRECCAHGFPHSKFPSKTTLKRFAHHSALTPCICGIMSLFPTVRPPLQLQFQLESL